VFKSILCPVDFSEHSERALRYAVELASLTGGTLTILTAEDPFLDAATSASGHAEALTRQTQDEVRQMLEKLAADGTHLEAPPAISIVTGQPGEAIVKHLAETGADVVVMGTQGMGAAKRLVFGSTTEHVLRESRVPVLAVPSPE
jgi:nucleotide-binding universal stress UspA family protein